jgi:hypothetical protein
MFVMAIFVSCAAYAVPEVSGPYAARLTGEDIQQITELAFSEGGIRRGVHSIYAKKPNEADVQSGTPKWPNDTLVSFSVRKKAGHWVIVPGSISTMHLIPTG